MGYLIVWRNVEYLFSFFKLKVKQNNKIYLKKREALVFFYFVRCMALSYWNEEMNDLFRAFPKRCYCRVGIALQNVLPLLDVLSFIIWPLSLSNNKLKWELGMDDGFMCLLKRETAFVGFFLKKIFKNSSILNTERNTASSLNRPIVLYSTLPIKQPGQYSQNSLTCS